jgi:hypothetical protein
MVTLSLAVAVGGMNANASVPLPILGQAIGVTSLAPLLKQITPAVVSIAIKGGANAAPNSSPSQRGPAGRQRARPAADRQTPRQAPVW